MPNAARQKPGYLADRLRVACASFACATLLGCLDFHALRERAREDDDGSLDSGSVDGGDLDGGPIGDAEPSSGGRGGRGGTSEPAAGAGGEPTQNRPPLPALDFPRSGATARDRIRVRGSVQDADGDAITSLTVTTGAGTFDARSALQPDGSFIVEVELDEGAQMIELAAVDERNERGSTTVGPVERTAYRFAGPGAAVLDATGDHALALDARDLTLVAIGLDDGEREVLTAGQATLDGTVDLALDTANDRVLIADPALGALRAITLATGEVTDLTSGSAQLRRVVVDTSRDVALVLHAGSPALSTVPLAGSGELDPLEGDGPALIEPRDLALDPARHRVLVSDSQLSALIAVDLDTGARSLVSGAARGRGPLPSAIRDLVIDTANDRALIVQARADHYAILEVELESGDRRLAADLELGSDPPLRSLEGPALFYDPDREALFVLSDEGRLAQVNLEPGTRHIVADSTIGQGPDIPIAALGFDTKTQRAIALGEGGLYAIDPVSGDRTLVSSEERGAGPAFGSLYAVAVDGDAGAAWVLCSGGLFHVELNSGDRERRSGGGTGSGPALGFGAQLLLDLERNRAIAVAGNAVRDLFAIDLASGDRSVLASASVGQGPAIDFDAVVLDPARDRLLAVGGDKLVAVDPGSGDRTLIADDDRGVGPDLGALVSLALDPYAERVLVVDSGANAVLAVDAENGDRTILTGPGIGEGPLSRTVLGQLAVDEARGQLLLIDGNKLLSVELLARGRTVVSDQRGATPATALVHDSAQRDALYVAEAESPFAVLHLDLSTDERMPFTAGPVPAWSLRQGRERDELLVLQTPLDAFPASESALYRVEPNADAPELLAGAGTGEGPLDTPRDVAWDRARERILLADDGLGALLALDPGSGARSIVSGASVGRGPALSALSALCIDDPRDRALVISDGRVLAIDLESGERSVLADGGTDDGLVRPTAIACDPDAERAFIADDGRHELAALDFESGELTFHPLPRRSPDAGPQPPATIDLDPELQVLYVLQPSIPGALIALDLVTFEHVLIGGAGP